MVIFNPPTLPSGAVVDLVRLLLCFGYCFSPNDHYFMYILRDAIRGSRASLHPQLRIENLTDVRNNLLYTA